MQATAVQTWQLPASGLRRQAIRLLPSLTDIVFILPIILLFGVRQGTKTLFTDGDTGWHIRTGEWILRHGAVPKTDLFSYTKPNQAWFAWEWGWDAIFAWIHAGWGLAGVALGTVALLCLIAAVVFRLVRRECGNDVLALLITTVFICGSSIHWLARPHVAGWLLLAVFYSILLSGKALWSLPLLMLVWTNIHGSFFIGLLLIAAWSAGYALEKLSWSQAKRYAVCAVACVAATFVNPYGWRLHEHVFEYLRDARQLDQIQEFQSISFHHGAAIFFELMLLLGAASVYWCLQRRKFAAAMTMIVWAHFALVSARNIPVFILIAAPWAACLLQDSLCRASWPRWAGKLKDEIVSIYNDFHPMERIERWHLASAFSLCIVGLLLASHQANCAPEFNPEMFPEQALPTLKAAHAARVFTYDQWGDFLIYRTGRRVFVDGRSDFYGADFTTAVEHTINVRHDWRANLDSFDVDTVLLKPNAPLATLLKQTPGWRVLFDDGRAIVLHTDFSRFSPVSRNGGNELEASKGLQVYNSSSRINTHERRSL